MAENNTIIVDKELVDSMVKSCVEAASNIDNGYSVPDTICKLQTTDELELMMGDLKELLGIYKDLIYKDMQVIHKFCESIKEADCISKTMISDIEGESTK